MEPAVERVAQARSRIRQVVESWDGAEMGRIQDCIALLLEAAEDLRTCEEIVRTREDQVSGEVRLMLLPLKKDIEHLMKLVDSGSAFCRGMAVRLGVSGSAYNSAGHVPAQDGPLEVLGMEG